MDFIVSQKLIQTSLSKSSDCMIEKSIDLLFVRILHWS